MNVLRRIFRVKVYWSYFWDKRWLKKRGLWSEPDPAIPSIDSIRYHAHFHQDGEAFKLEKKMYD